MFSLSLKERRTRGSTPPVLSRMSSQNSISGAGLKFQNSLFRSPSNNQMVRPSSRRTDMRSAPESFATARVAAGGNGEGLRSSHSLPKIDMKTHGKITRSKDAKKSIGNGHCEPIRLPEVKHIPKIKKIAEVPEKKKKKSKFLKERVLGSSDILPNRLSVPQQKSATSKEALTSDQLSNSQESIPSGSVDAMLSGWPPVNEPVVNEPARGNRLKPRCKVPAEQVYLRPKIDKDVLGKIQSRYKQAQPEVFVKDELEASRKTRDGSIKTVYSQMRRNINPDHIPSGGPMMMESKSVNTIILKPEVPPGLQVVRRKSKFMQNQNLQDVFSISERAVAQNHMAYSPYLARGYFSAQENYGYSLNPPGHSVKQVGSRWHPHHHDIFHGVRHPGVGGRSPRRGK